MSYPREDPERLEVVLHLPGRDPIFVANEDTARTLVLAGEAARRVFSILVLGESGVGKEVVARYAHAISRRPGVLETVDCGAVPDELLGTELFGHERGAFTGAIAKNEGAFQRAHKGTMFLDELGNASPRLQVGLLRVLEEREIRPMGGRTSPVDVLVIAATNEDLELRVDEGRFRADLLHRVSAITVALAPLRERREEILSLAELFLRRCDPRIKLADDARRTLLARPFPGNLRELSNLIRCAVVEADVEGTDTICARHLVRKANSNRLPPAHSRRRTRDLTDAECRDIEEYTTRTGVKREALAAWATERFGIPISKSALWERLHDYRDNSSAEIGPARRPNRGRSS